MGCGCGEGSWCGVDVFTSTSILKIRITSSMCGGIPYSVTT